MADRDASPIVRLLNCFPGECGKSPLRDELDEWEVDALDSEEEVDEPQEQQEQPLSPRLEQPLSPRQEQPLPPPELPAQQPPEDGDKEDATLSGVLCTVLGEKLRSIHVFNPEFIGALLQHLGKSAFLAVTSAVALIALAVLRLSRSMLRDYERSPLLQPLLARARGLLEQLRLRHLAHTFFEQVDFSQDGRVDCTELWALVLLFYAKLGALGLCVTPLPKTRIDRLARRFDLDGSGRLGQEEFLLLAAVLAENLAVRLAVQIGVSLVLAPLAAASCVERLATPNSLARRCCEALVPRPFASKGLAIAAATALLVALLVPFVLSVIDEVFDRKAGAKTARMLRRSRVSRRDGGTTAPAAAAAEPPAASSANSATVAGEVVQATSATTAAASASMLPISSAAGSCGQRAGLRATSSSAAPQAEAGVREHGEPGKHKGD